MILKSINIYRLGSLEHFYHELDDGLNIIKCREYDLVAYAIRLVLNHKMLISLPVLWTREGTKIEARLEIDEKSYFLTLIPEYGKPILSATDSDGGDVTEEYLYLCSHCAEQDISDIFDGEENKMLLRFLQYADEDRHYLPNELFLRTEGLSALKTFRAYLKEFIKTFKSEPIRDGRQHELILEDNGKFSVRNKNAPSLPVALSHSERTLFKYLCFLRTAEFWRGFEELRNLHSVKKPLLVKDFLCNLDESINVEHLLLRTAELCRQVIILS